MLLIRLVIYKVYKVYKVYSIYKVKDFSLAIKNLSNIIAISFLILIYHFDIIIILIRIKLIKLLK
jgi:hypothetical protein